MGEPIGDDDFCLEVCAGLIFGTDASAAGKNACSKDILKFCRNIKPDRVAVMDCLGKNESRLTPACKAQEAMVEGVRTERMEAARQAIQFQRSCKKDMAKFCPGVDPRQEGVLKCLNDHEKDISASCRESVKIMAEWTKRLKRHSNACKLYLGVPSFLRHLRKRQSKTGEGVSCLGGSNDSISCVWSKDSAEQIPAGTVTVSQCNRHDAMIYAQRELEAAAPDEIFHFLETLAGYVAKSTRGLRYAQLKAFYNFIIDRCS